MSLLPPPPPKNDKISSAFSYNFKLALTDSEGYPPQETISKESRVERYTIAPALGSTQPFLKGQVNQIPGGTRKHCSTWSYYFDLGQIKGKRPKKEKGGFKTKKEAEAALAKAISEYNSAGAVFELSETTVADFLDQRYDLYCKPNLKYNTQVG